MLDSKLDLSIPYNHNKKKSLSDIWNITFISSEVFSTFHKHETITIDYIRQASFELLMPVPINAPIDALTTLRTFELKVLNTSLDIWRKDYKLKISKT